ncbi:hypothetical protein ACFQ2C_08150 [Sphingobacterium daejeonense]|uniref:Uncharacterized protein n=1 Tax=Sphingobacterium daejeonense TaxID=371142 RepID=A0ABW3RL64_9SPHI|nr:Uncharacterised protein [Sphingobacterium daejeonense]
MDKLFDVCVQLLVDLAAITNTTYEEINVILFVFIMPGMLLILTIANFILAVMLFKKRRRFI